MDGMPLGTCVGADEGFVGKDVGAVDGTIVGKSDGTVDGTAVG